MNQFAVPRLWGEMKGGLVRVTDLTPLPNRYYKSSK